MTFTAGQVLTAAQMNALEAATVPTGSISMFGAASAPTGWLLCDGSAVSRTTYAGLFAVIGSTYGVGNGTSTFNLPNLKGRVPVGKDGGDTSFDALGEQGGAKTHTLTTSEMPSHTHTQNAHTHTQDAHGHASPSHSHGPGPDTDGRSVNRIIEAQTQSPATGWGLSTTATLAARASETTGSTAATINNATATNQNTTATNQNTGGDGAHNNLQPYLVLNFIIKT